MQTIEIINGQKVFAVDVDHRNGCLGCIFSDCSMPKYMKCTPPYRDDKRNIIYQERTFTLSQINEVIDGIMIRRESELKGVKIIYNSALNELKSKLEQL